MRRPMGVTVVATLTLLSSLALGFLTLVVFALLGVGGEGNAFSGGSAGYAFYYAVFVLPLFGLALYAFCVSIMLFTSVSRYAWYASTIFWMLITLVSVWLGEALVWRYLGEWFSDSRAVYSYQYAEIFATFIPLIYSIGCLAYFQTLNVRRHFGL